ncbi:MAG: hypothetical protein JSV16_16640 [Candidatus Hydrogenedentota bacterium]|nr:MAG: hypothetical protein JSV16_16640 [Candidatus Hydrogenedentota bacterium]
MSRKIIIEAGSVRAEAELNETKTARLIWDSLPVEARANTWGDEVYFDVPVKTGLENAAEVVNVGDIGYWPTGPAFCIFFGPTPASRGEEIRPASAVNLIGKVLGDAKAFRSVSDGQGVKLSRAE